MKDNYLPQNKFHWLYSVGFFIILALPILLFPPWLDPPDWGKTIIFRSILAILLFVFIYQLLYQKNRLSLPDIRKNKIIWLLLGLFLIFLLASIFSADPYFSFWGSPLRSGGFITFAFYFVFAVLAFVFFKKHGWKRAWDFSILIGILVSFIGIFQYYGLFDRIFLATPDRPPSTTGNPIFLGIYLLLLFFPTLSFAIKEKKLPYKLFYIFSLCLFFYVILIAGSRAAYLGLLTGALYFILFLPAKKLSFNGKKINIAKIIVIALLLAGVGFVYYVNTRSNFPKFLQDNRVFQEIQPRLAIGLFLQDPRFSAWQVEFQALKEKPILGWGPENLAIGFDKYYNPALPYISKEWGGWWDRGHNILLDTGIQAGLPAIIIYLALLVVLFWQLNKLKSIKKIDIQGAENTPEVIIAHGLQATIIGYFTANFFSFDSFPSYIIFFLIIGYSLHLTHNSKAQNETQKYAEQKKAWWKFVLMLVLFCVLVIFLWQYNLVPFQINSQINIANDMAKANNCDAAVQTMDNTLKSSSFLDAYSGMEYVNLLKSCIALQPEKNLEYAEKGVEVLKRVAKIRPLYSRVWIFLGGFDTAIAATEKDENIKESLLKDANSYFAEAYKLAPRHQEILVEQGKAYLIAGNYQAMEQNGEKCIALEPSLSDCYWIKGTAEIYLKEFDKAKEDITTAENTTSDLSAVPSLFQMAINGYVNVNNYEGLADLYQNLIMIEPRVMQYHSSLAFIYSKINEPEEAAIEALKVFYLSPQSIDEVNAFLSQVGYKFDKPTDYNYHFSLAQQYYIEHQPYQETIGEALIAYYISPSNNDVKSFLDKIFEH